MGNWNFHPADKGICIYPNAQQSYITGIESSSNEAMIAKLADFCRSGASLMNFGHFGRLAKRDEIMGTFGHIFPWATKGNGMTIEEMKARLATKEQIKAAIDETVEMLKVYKHFGWDGVSMRGDRFIDSSTNLREDEYGGPVKNRGRLLLELIKRE